MSVQVTTIFSQSRRLLKLFLPIELIMFGAAIGAAAVIILFDVILYFPDWSSSAFAIEHYVVPLITGSAAAIFLQRSKDTDQPYLPRALRILRTQAAFALIIFIHFNLKLWAQLINPHLFDHAYRSIDDALAPLPAILSYFDSSFTWLTSLLPNAYHDIFVAMFIISMVIHALDKNGQKLIEELGTLLALILVIGGLSYAIAPAWGPFVFEASTNEHANRIQHEMSSFQRNFVASGGLEYHGHNFISPLAAMPSLHAAHALALLLFAWKYCRWLAYCYIPAFVFILSEAVVSGWHYFIDLPAGIGIALISIALTRRLYMGKQPLRNTRL